jgi:hypothetical protein
MVMVRGRTAATSGSWVISSTVIPVAALIAEIAAITSSRALWSSWLVGSSASSKPGDVAIPTATAQSWIWPGVSDVSGVRAWSPRPTRFRISRGFGNVRSLGAARWAKRTLSSGVR